MPLVTPVAPEIFFLLFPPRRDKTALVCVTIELRKSHNELFAFLRFERTAELQLRLLALLEIEGTRASEGAVVIIFFDAVDALEAKVLTAGSTAGVGLLRDVVADAAFILCSLRSLLNIGFWLQSTH